MVMMPVSSATAWMHQSSPPLLKLQEVSVRPGQKHPGAGGLFRQRQRMRFLSVQQKGAVFIGSQGHAALGTRVQRQGDLRFQRQTHDLDVGVQAVADRAPQHILPVYRDF